MQFIRLDIENKDISCQNTDIIRKGSTQKKMTQLEREMLFTITIESKMMP